MREGEGGRGREREGEREGGGEGGGEGGAGGVGDLSFKKKPQKLIMTDQH